MAGDLNIKVKATLDTKDLQSKLNGHKGLNAEISKLKLDNEAWKNFKSSLEKKMVSIKAKLKLDGESWNTFKSSIEKKHVTLAVKTKLDQDSFKRLSDSIANKSVKVKVESDKAQAEKVGKNAGKTIGEEVNKSVKSSLSRTFKDADFGEDQWKKKAQNLSRMVDRDFFKNAKVGYTFDKDAEGNLKRITVAGEKADGTMKKLTFAVDSFYKKLKGEDQLRHTVSLINDKDVDKSEKALKRLEQSVIEFKRQLRASGDTGLIKEVERLQQLGKLDKDTLQTLKNKQALYQESRQKLDQMYAVQNKMLGLQQKLNIAQEKGTLSREKELEFTKRLQSIGGLDNNDKKLKSLTRINQEIQREIELQRELNRQRTASIAEQKKEEAFLRRKIQLEQQVQQLRAKASTESYSTDKYLQHLSRLQGITTSKQVQELDKLDRELLKVSKSLQTVNTSIGQTNKFETLSRRLEALAPKLKNVDQEFTRMSHSISNSMKTDRSVENLKRLESELGRLEQKVNSAVKSLKAGETINVGDKINFGSFKNNVQSFERDVQNLSRTMHGAKANIVSMSNEIGRDGQQMSKFKVRIDDGKKSVQEFAYVLNHASRELTRMGSELRNNANKNLGVLEQLKIALERVPVWFASTTLFYGSVQGIKTLTKEIVELDKAMTDLRRVASDDVDTNALFEGGIKMASELGNSAKDVLNTISEISRSYDQLSEQQQISLARTATIASNVSDLKADDAMKSLIATLNGYNFEVEKSIDLVDKMNEVDNNNSISTQQLSEAMMKASATAKTFGVDIDSLLGHVTAIGATTMESGKQIGNSLKTIYSRVTTLPDVETALKGVGVSIRTAGGDARKVENVFSDLAGKWKYMTDMERQNIAVKVAGRNHLTRFLALMNNWDLAVKATNDSLNSQGSAMRENAEYQKSLEARINRLKNSLSEMALAFGDAFLNGGFMLALDLTQGLMKGVSALAQNFGVLGTVLGLVGAGLVAYKMKANYGDQATSQLVQRGEKAVGMFGRMAKAIHGIPKLDNKFTGFNYRAIEQATTRMERLEATQGRARQATVQLADAQTKLGQAINAQATKKLDRYYEQSAQQMMKYHDAIQKVKQAKVENGKAGMLDVAKMNMANMALATTTAKINGVAMATNIATKGIGLMKAGFMGLVGFMSTAILPTIAFMALGVAIEKTINYFAKMKKEQEEFNKRVEEASDAIGNHGSELEDLVEDYDLLSRSRKEALSPKDAKKLEEVQNKINKLLPTATKEIDAQGNARLKSVEAVKEELELAKALAKEEKKISLERAQQKQKKSNEKLSDVLDDYNKKKKDYDYKKEGKVIGSGMGATVKKDTLEIAEANMKLYESEKKVKEAFKQSGTAILGVAKEQVKLTNERDRAKKKNKDQTNSIRDLTAEDEKLIQKMIQAKNASADWSKKGFDLEKHTEKVTKEATSYGQALTKLPPVLRNSFSASQTASKGFDKQAEATRGVQRELKDYVGGLVDSGKKFSMNSDKAKELTKQLEGQGISSNKAKAMVQNLADAVAKEAKEAKIGAGDNKALADSIEDVDKKSSDLAGTLESITGMSADQVKSTEELIASSDRLGQMTSRNEKQERQYKQVREELAKQFPDLVTGYNEQTGAVELNMDAIREEQGLQKEYAGLYEKNIADLSESEKARMREIEAIFNKNNASREEVLQQDAYIRKTDEEIGKRRDALATFEDANAKLVSGKQLDKSETEALEDAINILGDAYGDCIVDGKLQADQVQANIDKDKEMLDTVTITSNGMVIKSSEYTQKHGEGVKQRVDANKKNQESEKELGDKTKEVMDNMKKDAETGSKGVQDGAKNAGEAMKKAGQEGQEGASMAQRAWETFSGVFKGIYNSAVEKWKDWTSKKSEMQSAPAPRMASVESPVYYSFASAPTSLSGMEIMPKFYAMPPMAPMSVSAVQPVSVRSSFDVDHSYDDWKDSQTLYGEYETPPMLAYSRTSESMQEAFQPDLFDRLMGDLSTQAGILEAHMNRVKELSAEYRTLLIQIAGIEEKKRKESEKQLQTLINKNSQLQYELSTLQNISSHTEQQRERYNKLAQDLDGNIKQIQSLRVEIENLKNSVSEKMNESITNYLDEIINKYEEVVKKIEHYKTGKLDFQKEIINLTDEDKIGEIVNLNVDKMNWLETIKGHYENLNDELQKQLKLNEGNAEIVEKLNEQIMTNEKAWRDVTISILQTQKKIKDIRASVADQAIEEMRKYYEKAKEIAFKAIEEEKKALEKAHNQKLKNYDEEIAKITKLYDDKLKLMTGDKEEEDFNSSLGALQKERSEMLKHISLLSLDDSLDARKKKEQLLRELAEKETEINNMVRERERELAQKALEDQRDAEIQALEDRKQQEDDAYNDKIEKLDLEAEEIEKHYNKILDNEKYWADLRDEFIKGNFETIRKELEKMNDTMNEVMEGKFGDISIKIGEFSEEARNNLEEFSKSISENLIFTIDKAIDKVNQLNNAKIHNPYEGNGNGISGSNIEKPKPIETKPPVTTKPQPPPPPP
ncbi:phage tail tape measure protein, partial [Bacillus thuringiensis]|uniref:phage tail tape measure protein n=1 Tax=Bacillus thuringiensis TaxID=1428 RepID=UPI000BF65D7A